MFRFHWDPPILAALAEGPSKFRALHTRLEAHIGEHVNDNALSRSLARLDRAGLIRAEIVRRGKREIKTYHLSDKGREHLAAYEAFVAVHKHLHLPQEQCDGNCLVHGTGRAA